MESFDERDLVAVDRKVRQYIAQKKGLQKEKHDDGSNAGGVGDSGDYAGPKKATIAKARLLDGKNN